MRTILVAEDSRFFRAAVVKSLESIGYQVMQAADGEEALRLIGEHPALDLAVVDWHMPFLSGPEVCQQARVLHGDAPLYIILLTSQEGVESLVKGIDAGADDFVRKSGSFDELHARLRSGERILSLMRTLREERERLKSSNNALLETSRELREREGQLAQRSRLEAIGTLAAGMAHEINTPIQYIRDNTEFVLGEAHNLLAYMANDFRRGQLEGNAATDHNSTELDFEYLKREVPLALKQTLQGIQSIETIVRSLQDFTRHGAQDQELCDLNDCIVNVIRFFDGEWQSKAV
ncbi:MAG: response regulator, partial [Bdellovibrionales bacterium]|nr:response regulator [Bdellovibrionales bacterium]